jgi:hypothetical protein
MSFKRGHIHIDSLRNKIAGAASMPQHAGKKRLDIWRRLGTNDLTLRRWLMRFGQKDLAKVKPEMRIHKREELRAWIMLMGTEPRDRQRLFGWAPPTPATAVDEKTAIECNHWLRDLLSLPRHPDQPTITTPQVTHRTHVVLHRRGWAFISQTEGPDIDLFQHYTDRTLMGLRSELKICARCGTIFLRHGRQIYCSQRCAGTERKARWRKAQKTKN